MIVKHLLLLLLALILLHLLLGHISVKVRLSFECEYLLACYFIDKNLWLFDLWLLLNLILLLLERHKLNVPVLIDYILKLLKIGNCIKFVSLFLIEIVLYDLRNFDMSITRHFYLIDTRLVLRLYLLNVRLAIWSLNIRILFVLLRNSLNNLQILLGLGIKYNLLILSILLLLHFIYLRLTYNLIQILLYWYLLEFLFCHYNFLLVFFFLGLL